MPLSPPPSYDNCEAPPLPAYPNLQNLNYDHVSSNNTNTTDGSNNDQHKGGPPSNPHPHQPSMPNPMILPPSVPPGGVEGPPMLPPYPYPPPSQAPPYHNYNVGYYTHMNGIVGGGPLGVMQGGGEPPFCQGIRAGGNGRTTPLGGRYYVNASGYIEHLTAEQYQNRRIVQAIATVCAIILMIVVFFIFVKHIRGIR